ncbi:MAG: LCP family protein [Acetivibrionales bacterium]
MYLRKFYLILSLILSVFLFFSGSAILYYLNTYDVSAETLDNQNDRVNDILKPFVKDKEMYNILMMVGDKEEANTDTMMVVNFNTKTGTLNVLSIPRDTKVGISGLKIPKINSLYARKNGKELVINAVSSILGTKVDYYVYLNIKTFRQVIDALGGVDYYVPVDMHYDDPIQDLHIHLNKGQQLLDGNKAEQFLRFRHPNGNQYTQEMMKYYDGSDIKRIEAQQNFIKELVRQKANILYLPKINEIIDLVFSNLETDITLNEALKMAKNVYSFKIEDINTFTLPGESRKEADGLWYFIYDEYQAQSILEGNFREKE